MGDAELQPRGPGQPSKLPEVRERLLDLITNGINERGACAEVKIDYSTYLKWIARGRAAVLASKVTGSDIPDTEQLYVEFFRETAHAREGLQTRVEAHLRQSVPKMTPREAVDVLQRLDRVRWARQDRLQIEHTGNVDVTHTLGEQVAKLLQGVLDELRLTSEQAERAPQIVARHLQLVADNTKQEPAA